MAELELRWWLAALFGGAGCGLAGFFLLAVDLPFLAVCLAHSALAGAVLGQLASLPPLPCAFVASLLSAVLLGPVSDRLRISAASLSSILFSLSLGLAFLGIGLASVQRTLSMSLLWGNLLLVNWPRLAWSGAVAIAGLGLSLRFRNVLKTVLFNREIAWAGGIPAAFVLYLLIARCGLVLTVNLDAVGGLMLYSLLVNPAAAARMLSGRFEPTLLLTMALAIVSACAGLGLALAADWPVGASIVLMSAFIFAAIAVTRPRPT